MLQITKWAGKHPTLVRFIILPILFYIQCRMAFVLGAEMFFKDNFLTLGFLAAMFAINIVVCFAYPRNARALMHKHYYKLKTMQLVACISAAGMWGFVGNQTAAYFESTPYNEISLQSNLAFPFSALAVTVTSNTVENSESTMLTTKKVFKNYFKNAIAKIKKATLARPKADGSARVLLIILGILLLGFGVAVLVCGIQCGGASGSVALGIIGGIALLGLGIWALVGGFKRAIRMLRKDTN